MRCDLGFNSQSYASARRSEDGNLSLASEHGLHMASNYGELEWNGLGQAGTDQEHVSSLFNDLSDGLS